MTATEAELAKFKELSEIRLKEIEKLKSDLEESDALMINDMIIVLVYLL